MSFPAESMNLTNDKEMDLLLSRLARRNETRVPDEFGNGAGDGNGDDNAMPFTSNAEHLDADELNAYAENALLPAARARYAAHLADCDTCRKTVTDLALAAGIAGVLEKSASTSPQDISQARSWWKNLFALFNLPVVRYGVPALALLAIISVAFIITRQREDRALVAQNKETSPVSAVSHEDEQNHPQAPLATTANAPTPTDEKTQSGTLNPANGANNNLGQSSNKTLDKVEADSPKGDASVKEETRQERADLDVARKVPSPVAEPPVTLSKPSYAPAPEAAGRAEPAKDSPAKSGEEVASETSPQQSQDSFGDRRAANGGARSAEQQRQQQQARSMDRGRDMTIDGADDNTSVLKNKEKKMSPPASVSASAARRRGGGPAKTESKVERENAPADESTSGKRSVAGRTFHRQGNAWVDTAYDSSRATINVTRGSEHYRSLLADEPSLRTIAEQLGGEVIVVWKGRAYRIH